MIRRLQIRCASCALAVALMPIVASAYDISTHAYLTYEAYQRSVLNPSDSNSIVPALLFSRLDRDIPFNVVYADNAATNDDPALYTRNAQDQERAVFRNLIDAGRIPDAVNTAALEYRVDGWLMRGAVREDDIDAKIPVIGVWSTTDARDLDPWGRLFRSSRHFYDPIYDRGFDYVNPCADYGCVASPIWALGTVHPLSPPGDSVDTSRRNHFTWVDARINYWEALTKKRYPNGGTAADRANSAVEREERWATSLKSLGHVLHLLEDGAQPQHVRNDIHAPPPVNVLAGNPASSGAYEEFTDYRVLGVADTGLRSPLRYMDETLPDRNQLPDLSLNGYPIPNFATPERFFTTRYYDNGTDAAGINARRGIQDFADRNFFTSGTYPGFEQCVPPGSSYPCPARDTSPTYPLPENDLTNAVYGQVDTPVFFLNGYLVKTTMFTRQTVDPLNPSFDATVLPSQFGGKTPIVSKSVFSDSIPGVPLNTSTAVNYTALTYDGNVLLPRAVAYAAGMLNYFFRGRLTVAGPSDKVVAVLNQGAPHTMNAQGYPCVGTATNDGCPIFGFQSLRVSVLKNIPDIAESGGVSVPQTLSATVVGDTTDPSFTGPYLVAVARYHRNTCYKPDLSGERVQPYTGAVIEPSCASGQVVRTPTQEISVSKSAAVAAATLNGTSAFDVHFDFSADPIPVNATDLLIQVAYRGPMGDATKGQEPDAIAVGMLDVREPTFAGFWNNTDYFWSGSNWVHENSTNHDEGIQSFWVCAGNAPPKLVYQYTGAAGSPAMIDPIVNSGVPGSVRLAFVFPPPDFAAQKRVIQGTPVAAAGDARIPIESMGSPGEIQQANLENVDLSTLTTPIGTCNTALPTTPQYWCSDTIQKRRGQLFGASAIPFFLAPMGGATSASDVDSVPLPVFSGLVLQTGGTNRFDTDTTLASCPAQP